jgi:hypothetical protein
MDREAEQGLRENGIAEITPQVFDAYQWDPFWDAPLYVPGGQPDGRRTIGLPRTPDEIHRATATYKADGCEVKTDKTHMTATFPGVTLGVFTGQLQLRSTKAAISFNRKSLRRPIRIPWRTSTTPVSRDCRSQPTAS